MATQSPTPKKKEEKTAHPATTASGDARTMDFYTALHHVVDNHGYATKLEWGNPDIFIGMDNGHLCIHKEDNLFHPLLLRDVDITGTDWSFIGDALVLKDQPSH